MKLTFDPRYNIAYLRLAEKVREVETIQVGEDLHVDMTPDRKVYGIELLNAEEQLGAMLDGKLIVENESTGKTIEVIFP